MEEHKSIKVRSHVNGNNLSTDMSDSKKWKQKRKQICHGFVLF